MITNSTDALMSKIIISESFLRGLFSRMSPSVITSFFATVQKENHNFILRGCYMPKQTATPTSVTINTDNQAHFVMSIVNKRGLEKAWQIMKTMRCWITALPIDSSASIMTPSYTDEATARKFLNDDVLWFIHGRLCMRTPYEIRAAHFDLYSKDTTVIYTDIPVLIGGRKI